MDLDGIAIFVKVVQAGSFSGAARVLGVPNTLELTFPASDPIALTPEPEERIS